MDESDLYRKLESMIMGIVNNKFYQKTRNMPQN
jgi:hypothetical protein